jgi:hypothetical protein
MSFWRRRQEYSDTIITLVQIALTFAVSLIRRLPLEMGVEIVHQIEKQLHANLRDKVFQHVRRYASPQH